MILELDGVVINVVVIDMDTCIPEQTNQNADGSFTMFLNARHSRDTLRESFFHAAGHIKRGDWSEDNVQTIEASAHKKDHPARN